MNICMFELGMHAYVCMHACLSAYMHIHDSVCMYTYVCVTLGNIYY